jgi:hypothetical protein
LQRLVSEYLITTETNFWAMAVGSNAISVLVSVRVILVQVFFIGLSFAFGVGSIRVASNGLRRLGKQVFGVHQFAGDGVDGFGNGVLRDLQVVAGVGVGRVGDLALGAGEAVVKEREFVQAKGFVSVALARIAIRFGFVE